jgi:hypothetical protein
MTDNTPNQLTDKTAGASERDTLGLNTGLKQNSGVMINILG